MFFFNNIYLHLILLLMNKIALLHLYNNFYLYLIPIIIIIIIMIIIAKQDFK